ncbi:chemotaxis protein CheW [Halanaerobacter jeridensis]|uniref:Purine-binding chemotaxis protein CheW n=1 Tax=Halanaerobacter jeridensis TaxID=706427 RepID=A0A939BQ03_9FIRM|nr:chemotaxis protein CheW [Halanaerobacter jeridensis]MBM7557513.1 purine-binding chemotaxis protein CheW [Halanaerobacter jeridensis]
MANNLDQFIGFKLKDQEFGIGITEVDEIIPPEEITNLPGTEDFIEGMINLRGEVIIIVDLRKRLDFEVSPLEETRIMVVDLENAKVGFIVDDASEVIKIDAEKITEPSGGVAGIKDEYLDGIARLEERLVILLDLNKLLSTTERAKIAEVEDQFE